MTEFIQSLAGSRKFIVMLAILVALSGLLLSGKLSSAEFTDAIKFISTAFFAANVGGKIANKKEPQK